MSDKPLTPKQNKPAGARRPRSFLRLGTIGSRLLIAFIVLVVLPASIITLVTSILDTREAEARITAQLESVATLKEAEIQAWLNKLQDDLYDIVTDRDLMLDTRMLLEVEPGDVLRESAVRGKLGRGLVPYDELFLIDLQGQAVLSTERSPLSQDGQDFSNERLFLEGLEGPAADIRLDSPEPGEMAVFMARPIVSLGGKRIGILAGRINLETLNQIMLERAGLGDTGETYLVNLDGILLTDSRFEGYAPGQSQMGTDEGVQAVSAQQKNGSGSYLDYRGVQVSGVYRWLPNLQVGLLAKQDRAEALEATVATLRLSVGVTVLLTMAALVIGLIVASRLSSQLARLTEAATQIADGDLELEAPVGQRDEIGLLAQAFNRMTAQLRGLIGSLEERVAERTRDLERRSAFLEASAEVGHAATSTLKVDALMREAVELIRERFGLYYVGLFQVDAEHQWAILRAGTGAAGQAMLARRHRLEIGGESMIGSSIASGQMHVEQEAEESSKRLAVPELPDTRAEAALPLHSRGQVIGALTVQSDQPGTFDEVSLTVLQTLADQVAVALDNARLFAEAESALELERRAYGELSSKAWHALLSSRRGLSFLSDRQGTVAAGDLWEPQMARALRSGQATTSDEGSAATSLAIPIKVGERVIGVVDARRGGTGEWSPEEVQLMETLSEQVGVALESARLYQETQRREVRERVIREIVDEMQRATDLETLMRTTAEELNRVLGGSHAFVHLSTEAPLAAADGNGLSDENGDGDKGVDG